MKTASKSKQTQTARTRSARAAAQPADPEIWRVKITLVRGIGAKGPWHATLDVSSSTTLLALHRTINNLVQFGDDHLHTFFIAKTPFSRDPTLLEHHNGTPRHELTLAEIFPIPKGQKLFYWFDFGDDWQFSISRTRDAAQPVEKGVRYPRVIDTKGKTPEQYPSVD
jgi:hypothetical protein